MRAGVAAAWAHPSSQGTTTYETVLLENGALSCECPGWIYAKKGVRGCKHTRMHEKDQQAYVNGGTVTAPGTTILIAAPTPPPTWAEAANLKALGKIVAGEEEAPVKKAKEPVTKVALADALKQTRSRFANLDLDKSA